MTCVTLETSMVTAGGTGGGAYVPVHVAPAWFAPLPSVSTTSPAGGA
jgi:hypothetical protein